VYSCLRRHARDVSSPSTHVIEPAFTDEILKPPPNQRTYSGLALPDPKPSSLAGEDRTTATSALQIVGKMKDTRKDAASASWSMTNPVPAPARQCARPPNAGAMVKIVAPK